jgi:hypothetical protein
MSTNSELNLEGTDPGVSERILPVFVFAAAVFVLATAAVSWSVQKGISHYSDHHALVMCDKLALLVSPVLAVAAFVLARRGGSTTWLGVAGLVVGVLGTLAALLALVIVSTVCLADSCG